MQKHLGRIACGLSLLVALASGCGPAGARGPGEDRDLSVGTDGSGSAGEDGGIGGGGGDDLGAPGCPTSCSPGAKSCDGNGVRTCQASTGACNDWSTAVACGAGNVCSGGVCAATCSNQCTAGATYCSANGFRTCITTISGCTDWSPSVTACPNGQVCSGGACTGGCTDRCAPNATQCTGAAVQTCERKSSGCLDWSDPTPCGGALVCSGGQCAASCTNQCAMGAKQCVGADSLQTCAMQASGCLDWSPAQICGSGSCAGNLCAPCTDGAKRCGSSGNVEQCSSGAWVAQQACGFGCAIGACTTNVTCTPGAYRCNGLGVEICNSSGSAYLHTSTCAIACSSGLCTGACTPNDRRCNGNKVETCDATGTVWNLTSTCPTFCDAPTASCTLDKLDVTMNPQNFDQDVLVVDGAVTVKVGGVLNATKGALTIRAKSITVENGGSITVAVSPNGTPDGLGGDGITYCPNVNYRYSGGSGGSYGTSGINLGCSALKAAFGSAADATVVAGSAGGKGYTDSGSFGGSAGHGGGVLRLIATTINIQSGGVVSANGENGGTGSGNYGGGGGGGSGGGILIAGSDSVTIAGTVSASGGSGGGPSNLSSAIGGGKGGDGRVKILYGASKNVTGTITGVLAADKAILPPLTITSSTHPSSDLVYNDDFSVIALSWNLPFAARQGYYNLLDRTPLNLPGPGNATLVKSEVISIDRSKLTTLTANGLSDYYFHIATIDSMSFFSAVENTFKIHINTAAPAISSSSHPVPATWYANRDVFFQWPTLPAADANFQRYYYVLDHYGTTVPTTSAAFIASVAQKQLLISDLADGIWAFHLVTMDQQGYLTKNASLYRVRIGAADPGTGTINGNVTEMTANGSQPIAGATVSINRGLLQATPTTPDATTLAPGSYSTTVPAGTWEVQIAKPGYQTAVKMINVTKAGTATADFSLVKIP